MTLNFPLIDGAHNSQVSVWFHFSFIDEATEQEANRHELGYWRAKRLLFSHLSDEQQVIER
jgi:hypothetical protein